MPPTSRRVYRRRRITVASVVIVVAAVAFYLPITLLAPVGAITASKAAYSAPVVPAPVFSMPRYGASAIGAVGYPGLLASGGTGRPLPIGSVTKIVTSLVVLEKKPLKAGQAGPGILFTAADQAIRSAYLARNGDAYPVRVGAQMSERDVLTIGLVPSANNYIRKLVDWAFGSEANFLPVARHWLSAHGLTSTTLTDSTGLNPTDRSTPRDLIALGQLALADPILSRIVKIKHAVLPVVGTVDNTNKLLGVDGVYGIKTGTLEGAGATLLFASRYELDGTTITFVGAVIDGPDHPTIDARIRKLIATARTGFRTVTLVRAGQRFGSYRTRWGATSTLVAAETKTALMRGGTKVSETATTTQIRTASKGAVVGVARFTLDGTEYSVPLVLGSAIADPGPWWRLTHPGQLS